MTSPTAGEAKSRPESPMVVPKQTGNGEPSGRRREQSWHRERRRGAQRVKGPGGRRGGERGSVPSWDWYGGNGGFVRWRWRETGCRGRKRAWEGS